MPTKSSKFPTFLKSNLYNIANFPMFLMDITIFAGKGGVGKSTAAAAYAFDKAKCGPVILVDYDGGHSLHRVLSMEKERRQN